MQRPLALALKVRGRGKHSKTVGACCRLCLLQKAALTPLLSLPSTCRAAARSASPFPDHQEQRPQLHLLQLFPALSRLSSRPALGWCSPFILGRQNLLYICSCLTQASSLGSVQKVVCPPQQCGDIECPDASSTLAVAGRWMATYKACPRATTNTLAVTSSLDACCVYLLDLNIA